MNNPITRLGQGAQEETITFPSDVVPGDPKQLSDWMKRWTDAIINYGQFCFSDRDAANENCAYGVINANDYSHITNLFVAPTSGALGAKNGGSSGLQKSLPAKLRPINVVAAMVNKMVGRVEGEKFDFSAYVVNEEAVSQKLEDFSAEYAKKLTRFLRQQSGLSEILGSPLVEGDDVEQVMPKEVEEANLSTFQQENEIQVTNGLAYLLSKKSIFLKHKLIEQGLRSYAITGKMAFDTYIENDPTAQFIPPQNLIYELNSNSPFIQHGRYSGYNFPCTPQELCDRCPELTDEQVREVEETFKTLQANGLLNQRSWWHKWDSALKTFFYTPYKVYWSGMKRLRVKITPNPFDDENPHIHFIGDNKCKSCDGTGTYVKKKTTSIGVKEKEVKCRFCKGTGEDLIEDEKGEKVEYRYFKTWFECLKIGQNIYYQPREIPGQHQSQDEPEVVDGPLVGVIDPNPCIVDLIRPLSELRIECWYVIERLLGQAKGNILVVDEAGGQDVWGQNYNMLAFGVYVEDSSLEGPDGQRRQQAPVVKDMGLSQAVSDIMRMIAFIDQNIAQVTGDNDASRGVIKSDQGLGITQNAMMQAQFTLQPYYAVYYTTVEMVLQALCDLMRPAWSGRKKTAYFVGDAGKVFFDLDPGKSWHLADYGISLQNSVGATQSKQYMISTAERYAQVSTDPEVVLGVLKMIGAKSDAECLQVFKASVEAVKKVKDETDKRAQANTEAAMKQKAAEAQQEQQVEDKKASAPVQVAEINAASKQALLDKKQTHEEDKSTVDFKNDILKMAAEIMKNNEMKKAEQPEEQPA